MIHAARPGRVERFAAAVLPTVLAVCAFGLSFNHVRQVAADHGADGAEPWVYAITVELLVLAALLEIRRRRRSGGSLLWPRCVAGVGVLATLAANLKIADSWGWDTAVAVWAPVAYLLVASLKAGRPVAGTAVPAGPGPVRDGPGSVRDAGDADPAADPEPEDEGEEEVEDPDPLLQPARAIVGLGPLPTRDILLAELRGRGHRCRTERGGQLLRTLAAERNGHDPAPNGRWGR